MASRMRWTARVGVAALAVGVAAPTAWAATWTPSPSADKATGVATAQYSFNYGSSLAKVGTDRLASVYTTDVDVSGGNPDGGDKQKAMVRVGTVDGTTKAVTWSAPVRISPVGKHVDRTSLAASGTNLYAVYATQVNYTIDPAAPRQAFIRRSTDGGATWQTAISLSAKAGRVDYPIVAASGSNVYVAFTNSNTGAVVMRRSTDNGASFGKAKNLGTTTRQDGDEGLGAWPISCANGTTAAAAWLPGDGTVALSVSENRGRNYTKVTIPASDAGGDDGGWANCDARGSRVGVTWNEDDGVYYAEYNTGTDTFTTPRKQIYAFSGSGYLASYSGSVSLIGTGRVGIAAPLCLQDGCDYTSNSTRIDLKWLESNNNGDTWGTAEAVANASAQASAGKSLNDSPSSLYWDNNTRFVLYNGWNANYGNYRLYLSTGVS
jgi:hypothetical protein